MAAPLQLLLVEDNPDDAELLNRALGRTGLEVQCQRVETEIDFLAALEHRPDLVISDYELPQFNGLRALQLLRKSGLDVPFIIVSGTIGEDTAVTAIKQGASDYLLKDRLGRLGSAITHALEEGRLRREGRQAIEALRQSEARLRMVTDNARVGLVMVNREHRYTFANAAYAKVLGLDSENLVGRHVGDVLAPLYEQQIRPRLDRAFAGERVAYELRRPGPDGVYDYAVRYEPAEIDGVVQLVVVVVTDISERKHAEGVLREREEQLRLYSEHSPVAVAMLDREMKYLVASRRWIEDFRLGEMPVIGRSHYEIFPEIPLRWREIHQRCLAGAIEKCEEDEFPRPDGGVDWIRWEIRPWRRADRAIGGIIIFCENITARKRALAALMESEQRFRQMAESIEEVFWMTDMAKNQILYVSPAYERIWGRLCDELYASPQTWMDAIHPEDRERILAALGKQATGDYQEEYRILRPDGVVRWIHDQAFPVRDPSGQVYRVVGVASDITARRKLEEQFLHAQRMEAIGTLAGGMAHDLNNILSPVLMVADLLKAKLASPQDQRVLQLVENSARRGAAIIRQLLMFSRGVSGEKVSVQLRHLIKEMTGIMRETFPRDITITDQTRADLWPVLGDATQLHQVLMNLCVNARDAMPQGGYLTLEAENLELSAEAAHFHPHAKAERYVVLSIADTGQGIPAEILTRIFDPFFTTKEIGKGTGLGLSTVLGIAKSHGGFVTVDSELGKGSKFKIYLPAEKAAAPAAASAAPAGLTTGRGEMILLVDDEEPIRTAITLMLHQQGYQILTAENGQVALELFAKNQSQIRLVITDLMMPVMGGIALMRALRALHPALDMIATTGLDQQDKQRELAELGVTEILLKPCAAADLLETIQRKLQPH